MPPLDPGNGHTALTENRPAALPPNPRRTLLAAPSPAMTVGARDSGHGEQQDKEAGENERVKVLIRSLKIGKGINGILNYVNSISFDPSFAIE